MINNHEQKIDNEIRVRLESIGIKYQIADNDFIVEPSNDNTLLDIMSIVYNEYLNDILKIRRYYDNKIK